MNLGLQTFHASPAHEWTAGRVMSGFGESPLIPPMSRSKPTQRTRPGQSSVYAFGGFWDWASALVMPAPLGLALAAVNLGSDDGWMAIGEEIIGGTGFELATGVTGEKPKGFFASAGEGVGKGVTAFGAGVGKGVGTAIAIVALGVVGYLLWKAPSFKR